jgi:hypothetical protein
MARCEAVMAEEPVHPMAAAMQWVARVFAAALMMCLPGIGGQRLDARWGTSWIGPAGFVAGLVGGMAYLIAATRAADSPQRSYPRQGEQAKRDDDEPRAS